MSTPVECVLSIDGLEYAMLDWGGDGPLLLAIHGWLDDANSFQTIAPEIKEHRVVAVDLSGHGYSSHRSSDATYNIWDDVPQLVQLIDQFTAGPVTLLGHSRGAAISTLLAATLGERCRRLVMLDGLLAPSDARDTAEQLRLFVSERIRYRERPDRIFQSIEEFVAARRRFGFTDEHAQVFTQRSLEPCEQGYRLRTDARLYGASSIKLTRSQVASVFQAITAPALVVWAEQGFWMQRGERVAPVIELAQDNLQHLQQLVLPGGHHLHLDRDVEQLAEWLNEFLSD
jgi:pimeloyl-ACP methyl ester carboxylesterase